VLGFLGVGACTGPIGVVGICLFAEMAGRVATVSGRRCSTWSASAIDLSVPKAELETDRLEAWARDHLIGKLPGAGDAPD
jgi:hypothetical protein